MIMIDSNGIAHHIPSTPDKRKAVVKAVAVIFSVLMIMLTGLAMLGWAHDQGVKDGANHPSQTVLSILDYAKQTGAKGCKVVYSADYQQYEVVCDRPIQITNLDADRDPQR